MNKILIILLFISSLSWKPRAITFKGNDDTDYRRSLFELLTTHADMSGSIGATVRLGSFVAMLVSGLTALKDRIL